MGKIYFWTIIIAVFVLLILIFGIAPIINDSQSSSEGLSNNPQDLPERLINNSQGSPLSPSEVLCAEQNIPSMLQNGFVFIGKSVSDSFIDKFTHTTYNDLTILNGEYNKDQIIVQVRGGCDPITEICTSGLVPEIGHYYLFISSPENKISDKEDLYIGGFYCGGGYSLVDNPLQRQAHIDLARQAFIDKDEQKWEEFLGAIVSAGYKTHLNKLGSDIAV